MECLRRFKGTLCAAHHQAVGDECEALLRADGSSNTECLCRCERVRVRFQQRDVGGEWEALEPGTAADFAWEEPLAARRLRVRMDGCGGAWRNGAVHEYSLDVLRVCLPAH